MFFPTRLNIALKTWEFLPTSIAIFQANEMYQSQEYINRINDTFTNFKNEAQNYPTGFTFNYQTGKYVSV
jgi:hypothetical protein